ncbi:DUF2244 domain-containing protein [Devosia chinhatensis]|uniref:DUF2244 domain-containing protein n=1 Tax=Devosia chinhatensis TaxID=429727 RepID=A0A0F5FG02_9HYPH|nr:DUF2244 domain-containing protein [Devosia chinhatensis]KKB07829.1 hypothetical protein VE26_14390 [Devosia chinhatensis]
MQATKTTPLFAATLRPDRSLRAAGGWIGLVVAGLLGAPLLVAMPEFVVPGLAAYGMAGGGLVAFGLRQRRRGSQFQQVTLWTDQLEITAALPGKDKVLQRFEPATVRLRLSRDGFERTTGIFLRHETGEIELGSFLSRDDKSSFARAFGAALRKARRSA